MGKSLTYRSTYLLQKSSKSTRYDIIGKLNDSVLLNVLRSHKMFELIAQITKESAIDIQKMMQKKHDVIVFKPVRMYEYISCNFT